MNFEPIDASKAQGRISLGCPVEVEETLTVWADSAGWGDGPFDFHPGAHLWLDYAEAGRVYYYGGTTRPEVPSGRGGHFPVEDLFKVRRIG